MISDDALMAYLDREADPERVATIEAALSSDPRLRARLAAMSARDDTVRSAFDALLERPVPASLVAAARKGSSSRADNVVPLKARPSASPSRFGGAPRWVGWALAAQAAVLAGAVVLTQVPHAPQAPAAEYRALGVAPTAEPANAIVIFKPETRESDLRGALAAADARMVGGPTAAGAWLLHVAPQARATALQALRHRPDIVLAEPVDAR